MKDVERLGKLYWFHKQRNLEHSVPENQIIMSVAGFPMQSLICKRRSSETSFTHSEVHLFPNGMYLSCTPGTAKDNDALETPPPPKDTPQEGLKSEDFFRQKHHTDLEEIWSVMEEDVVNCRTSATINQ